MRKLGLIFLVAGMSLPSAVGFRAAEGVKPDAAPGNNATASTNNVEANAKKSSARAVQSISSGYDESRDRLKRAGDTLRQATDDAARNLEPQLKKAQDQLEGLRAKLEEEARLARGTTAAKAREIEQGIAQRAKRLEARTLLLETRARTTLAVQAAKKNDFTTAGKHLADATELLRKARALLADDHTYDAQLIETKAALNEATSAVKVHGDNARKKIEEVLNDTDKVVGSLEVEEQKAVIRGN